MSLVEFPPLLELINSVKLQDTKSVHKTLLHFYTLIMKYQKEKYGKIPHLQLHPKKPNISRNEFNQGGERPVY